jgi:hypothetical protein
LVSRTRAIFRIAELGFFGVLVVTFVQTPRLNGDGKNTGRFLSVLNERRRATAFGFRFTFDRFRRTSWFMVGISIKNLGAPRQARGKQVRTNVLYTRIFCNPLP